MKRTVLTAALFAAIVCTTSSSESAAPAAVVPWAWERPEDLRFIGSGEVAWLCATFRLRGDRLEILSRRQPLRAGAATLIPVFRIETRSLPPDAAAAAIARTIAARFVADLGHPPRAVQIDFDATESQRAWYAHLLHALRAELPRGTSISITALASWCMDDRWLSRLDADEVVPMLFRLGAGEERIRDRLRRGGRFADRRCRGSAGLSTDEPVIVPSGTRRVYVFNPQPWTAAAWSGATEEITR